MLNHVQIIGRLGADPELRYTQSGDAVANLRIATTESWKDKNSGQPQERTEWHKVSFFGRIAEVCGEYLQKGALVYVSGSIQTRKWQDQSGQDRYTTEIKGREMKMLGSRGNNQGGQQGGNQGGQQGDGEPFSDDIPF